MFFVYLFVSCVLAQSTTITLSKDELSMLAGVLSGTRIQLDSVGNGPKVNGSSSYVQPGDTLKSMSDLMGEPMQTTNLLVQPVIAAGCSVRVNNVNTVLANNQTLKLNLVGDAIGIWVTLDSTNPTLILSRSRWWSVCPDIQLSNMALSIVLQGVKAAQDGSGIDYRDVNVAFGFDMDIHALPNFPAIKSAIRNNLQSMIRDGFVGASGKRTVSTAIVQVLDQKQKLSSPGWKGIAKITKAGVQNETLTLDVTEKA